MAIILEEKTMGNLSNNLNTALLANKINVAAIVPLAGYLSFSHQSRNAPILELEALFQTESSQPHRFSYDIPEKTWLLHFRTAC